MARSEQGGRIAVSKITTEQESEESVPVIHVQTVDLSARGVTLPSDRVGMVIAQPHLFLTDTEPYQCVPAARPRQLAVLTETLKVARAASHGAPITHFTVFPEYSIPGLDGIATVDNALRNVDWPDGTIVIGGTDGLSRADFVTLAGSEGTHLDTTHNGLGRIAQDHWINCAVTWVKGANGSVERWLQPKLWPAWPEQDTPYQHMFRGKSVFMFRGALQNEMQYRFCLLVCFDWIATVDNQKAWHWVMQHLQRQAHEAHAELSLSWFFVIQHNRRPSDDCFLTEVARFFDQNTLPNVRRERACLVFANSAGRTVPGRADLYGCTSLVFAPQTLFTDPQCRPTFCNGGPRFRSSTVLAGYHDILFRERGACIHSFVQVNPNSLIAGPAGKATALDNALVFPLDGTIDPRAPGAAVPACIKWLNDELDHVASLSAQYPDAALAAQADTTHQESVLGLREISSQSATRAVNLAAAKESDVEDADDWDHPEAEAVEHLVHTLDIIGLGFPKLVVGADSAHATVATNSEMVDLLAIRGNTHEACIDHSRRFLPLPRRQVLLISRDRDNTPWRPKFGTFLEANSGAMGEERKFTDPNGGLLHLGYQQLLDIFRNSGTAAAVQGAINAELAG